MIRWVLLFILCATPATAGQNAWITAHNDESGVPVCFATADSTTRNGAAHITITHRPAEKNLYVFHYDAGVELALGKPVMLEIDKKNFILFSTDDTAWARSADLDRAIAKAIGGGRTLRLTATTSAGKKLNDQFPLTGSAQALKTIDTMCGL